MYSTGTTGEESPFALSRRLTVLLILAAFAVREIKQRNLFSLIGETVVARNDEPNNQQLFELEVHNATWMRACILIKNDNRRLAEWVAYHYTVLPLRYLIVGSDVNSTEDPMDVLGRWNNTPLNFEVWYADDVVKGLEYKYQDALMNYIERQSNFYALCMQHFHRQGNLGWIALSDSDEYLKLNPLDDIRDKHFFPQGQKPKRELDKQIAADAKKFLSENETWWDRVVARKALRKRLGLDREGNQTTIPTVVDVLEEYASRNIVHPCYNVARLQYSAVTDNFTDLAASTCRPKLDPEIQSSMNISDLTTVRYLYHANPDEFDHNKWSKALIDLRRYSHESLAQIKFQLNPHSPLNDCPRPPFLPDVVSILRVNHYLNDVSIFLGREGDPRQKKTTDWSESAHVRDRITCDHMYAWLNAFVGNFGMEKAKELLRQEPMSL